MTLPRETLDEFKRLHAEHLSTHPWYFSPQLIEALPALIEAAEENERLKEDLESSQYELSQLQIKWDDADSVTDRLVYLNTPDEEKDSWGDRKS